MEYARNRKTEINNDLVHRGMETVSINDYDMQSEGGASSNIAMMEDSEEEKEATKTTADPRQFSPNVMAAPRRLSTDEKRAFGRAGVLFNGESFSQYANKSDSEEYGDEQDIGDSDYSDYSGTEL